MLMNHEYIHELEISFHILIIIQKINEIIMNQLIDN